jgi:hypothetical protein
MMALHKPAHNMEFGTTPVLSSSKFNNNTYQRHGMPLCWLGHLKRYADALYVLVFFSAVVQVFASGTSLKKHMYVHGAKQFPCTFPGCTRAFVDAGKLARHQLSHMTEKKHICPACNKVRTDRGLSGRIVA